MLVKFYLLSIQIIHSLPKWMRNPNTLERTVRSKEIIELAVTSSAITKYDKELETIKSKLRRLHSEKKNMFSFKNTVIILTLTRILAVITAWNGLLNFTIVLILTQVIVAPYSIFVSFTLACALVFPIYFSHYIFFTILQTLISSTLYLIPATFINHLQFLITFFYLPIGPGFIVVYFFLDMALCFYCHFLHTDNNFSLKKTLIHIAWGFINTKTYSLIILLHAMNAEASIPILIWLLDAYFGVTSRLATAFTDYFVHWMELLYAYHRMAHLPTVYDQAHKFHHFLHGSSPFDAHSIFGNGMPEEFCFLLLELVCVGMLGITPAHVNFFILSMIVNNKFAHRENPEDISGDNFHSDHHKLQVKNFGANCLLDMFFSTSSNNSKYRMMINNARYQVEKRDEGENVVFRFIKIGSDHF